MAKISKYIIDKIRQEHLITDWLSSQGISQSHSSRDYYVYKCPIPGHNDDTPSFIVYDRAGSYQNYFCWGCKASGDIISLYSSVKQVNWYQAAKEIGGEDLEVTSNEELKFIISSLKRDFDEDTIREEAQNIMSKVSFDLSNLCYEYLIKTNFDEEEAEFLEKIYFKIDTFIAEKNILALSKLRDFITDGDEECNEPPLLLRYNNWEKKKEHELRRSYEQNY